MAASIWSDNFDDGDVSDLYIAYDDHDSGNSVDHGDVVEASNSYFVSGSYSLHIKAVSVNGGGSGFANKARAFATSPYIDSWDTSKDYNISFNFMLTNLSNQRFVVIKTTDIHILVNNSILEAYSEFTSSSVVIMTLNYFQWYHFNCSVDKASLNYVVDIDGTPFGPYDKATNIREPKTLFFGDLGDEPFSVNNLGEGYWDDIELNCIPLAAGVSVNAGPDQIVNESDIVTFNGTEISTIVPIFWETHPFGFDRWITNSDPDTWLTSYQYGGSDYPGLVAVEYDDGRAVYGPGGALEPGGTNGYPIFQILGNAVRWVTKGSLANQTHVLVIWGHKELVTYHSTGWNTVAALRSEGYIVNTSRLVPSNLSEYQAVVMIGTGWTWLDGLSQQAYNEGWYAPTSGPLSQAEIDALLSFISNGSGFVASAEMDNGASYLNPLSQPMGVTFGSVSTGGGTAHKIVNHTILEKWENRSAKIINYRWDFGDGTVESGPTLRNITHVYGDDGKYTVTFTVTDERGRIAWDSLNVTVLNVDPSAIINGPSIGFINISANFSSDATDLGSDDLTFVWNWSDGSSDNITTYYNNGANPDPYSSPDGIYPFSATDMATHVYTSPGLFNILLTVIDDDSGTTVKTKTIIVFSPPTTTMQYGEPNHINPNTGVLYVNSSTPFTLTPQDYTGTGIKSTHYKIDDGNWINYTAIPAQTFVIPHEKEDGVHKLYFYSIDNLDNVEAIKEFDIWLDNTLPTTIISTVRPKDSRYSKYDLDASDNEGSGVKAIYYRIDGNSWHLFNEKFRIKEYGLHTIEYYSIDNLSQPEGINKLMIYNPSPEMNYKPIIALIFCIVILFFGLIVGYKRPLRLVNRKTDQHTPAQLEQTVRKDRLYTCLLLSLPFGITEAIIGIVSWFSGVLGIPPWIGVGLFVNVAILVSSLIIDALAFYKGQKAEPQT